MKKDLRIFFSFLSNQNINTNIKIKIKKKSLEKKFQSKDNIELRIKIIKTNKYGIIVLVNSTFNL